MTSSNTMSSSTQSSSTQSSSTQASSTPSQSKISRFAWGTLAFNLFVILWGAFVRATGSGAGCGSHWPLCNGEVLPRDAEIETLIELSHRLTSGMALILTVILVVLVVRGFQPGHRARHAAWWSLIFILGEATIGAGLVLLELVADNPSMTRAWAMAAHLVNTLLLITALTLCAWWAGGAPALRLERRQPLKTVAAAFFGTACIAASGAIAALGDTLYPATNLAHELRHDFTSPAELLKQLRIFHPLIAVLVSLLILHLMSLVRQQRWPQPARRFANWVSLLVFVQLAAGTVNVLLLAPIAMQLLHLLLANLLWIAMVLTCAAGLVSRQVIPGDTVPVDTLGPADHSASAEPASPGTARS